MLGPPSSRCDVAEYMTYVACDSMRVCTADYSAGEASATYARSYCLFSVSLPDCWLVVGIIALGTLVDTLTLAPLENC